MSKHGHGEHGHGEHGPEKGTHAHGPERGAHGHGHEKGTHGHGHEEVPLDPDMFGVESPCFGCSPRHPIGFHLRFARRGDEVVTRFVPGENHQGPPGVMHGALVAALADEIAAWAIIALKGRFGFTVALEARLSKPVRVGAEVEGTGRIESETPRFTKIAVDLRQSGAACFKGTFTFAVLDEAAAEKVIGGPLPPAWRRFAKGS